MIILAKARIPNKIICYEHYADIFIQNRSQTTICTAQIDLKDVYKVANHKWHKHSNGYVSGVDIKGKRIYLHRYLLDLDIGNPMTCDHIDGNRLNNRKENLRILSMVDNNQNKPSLGGTSKYRGVYFETQTKKWRGACQLNKKTYHTLRYDNEEDAYQAIKQLREKMMKYTNPKRDC